MLPEEVIQFLLPAADTVGVTAGQPQGLSPHRSSSRAAIFGYNVEDFEHGPLASWLRREGWNGCELHTCVQRKVV